MNYFVTYLRFFISGLAFGIANVIPGVSGGTMLVVFGIYDKLTEAISGVKAILKNFWFLFSFVLGAGSGVLGFAFVITWLFESFGVQTNMFFIGLILGSVPLIVRTATASEKIKPLCAVPFIIGFAVVIGLAVAENATSSEKFYFKSEVVNDTTSVTIYNNSSREIESWTLELTDESASLSGEASGALVETSYPTVDKIKQMLGMSVEELQPNTFVSSDVIRPDSTAVFTYNGVIDADALELNVSYKMDVSFFLTMMAALFIAAVAMIIPGVSGSFVMMMLGVYTTVIGAIKSFDLMIIIPCAIGALFGIVLGSKLISTLLKKHALMVYSLIMGLVIGSVYAIIPSGFGFNLSTGYGFVTLICGILVSLLIDKIGKPAEEK